MAGRQGRAHPVQGRGAGDGGPDRRRSTTSTSPACRARRCRCAPAGCAPSPSPRRSACRRCPDAARRWRKRCRGSRWSAGTASSARPTCRRRSSRACTTELIKIAQRARHPRAHRGRRLRAGRQLARGVPPLHARRPRQVGEAGEGERREARLKVIAIEEHFITPMYREKVGPTSSAISTSPSRSEQIGHDIVERTPDLGEQRLAHMDAAGVDVQVLSFGSPGAAGLRRRTSRSRWRAMPTTGSPTR